MPMKTMILKVHWFYSRKTKDVIGFYHSEANNANIYFDPSYDKFQKSLNKTIPDVYHDSVSKDENNYI